MSEHKRKGYLKTVTRMEKKTTGINKSMINLFKPQGAANGVHKDQRLEKLHAIKPGRQMQYANGPQKQIVQNGNMHLTLKKHIHTQKE